MAINRDEVLKYYPQYAWMLDIPDVAPILEKAVSEKYDAGRLTAELQSTTWWKKTEPNVRTYQQRLATDPAAVDQQKRELEAKLFDQSQKLGLNLDAATIQSQAANAIQFDINETQMVDNLVAQARQRGYQGTQGNLGGISNSIAELKKSASSYYVTIDDNTAFQWATQVAAGERSVDDFNNVFKDWSKAKFSHDPNMVARIDEGYTPEQLFQPQKNTIAKLLEVDPSTVNMLDNRWSQVLDYADPNAQGTRRSMTESETAKLVRGTAEWKKTTNGQQAAAGLAGNIRKMMTGQ